MAHSGNGPFTYSWAPSGGNAATATNLAAGTYTVNVTDNGGCTAIQTVTITEPNLLTGAVVGVDATCGNTNGSASVTPTAGTGPFTYLWSNSQTSQQISGLGAGTFSVTITDANGCTATQTVTVNVTPLPIVTYNETQTTTCVNWNPITLSPGSPAGGTYSGTAVTGNTFAPATAGTGTYTITYTYSDVNGCVDSATSQIMVDLCTGTNQIPVPQLEVAVFPNPFDETIIVQCDHLNGTASVELFNLLGEVVYSSVIVNQKTEINLEGLPGGTYFIRINSDSGSIMQKIVKQ